MYEMGQAAIERLQKYFADIGDILGNDERRASFANYALGLLSETERKSVEPLAAQRCIDPEKTDAAHQRLLHFLCSSKWNDHSVRKFAAEYGLSAMLAREDVQSWIIDDTGFIKQGVHSVG